MAVANQITKANPAQERTISEYLSGEKIKTWLNRSLGSESARQNFVSNVVSCVSANPDLQKCDFSTVVSGGLLATSLKLSLNPTLGLSYLVPFEDRKNNRTVATFILGYRGFIQLAIRSGYYIDIDAMPIYEGEYKGRDKTTGKPVFEFSDNDDDELSGKKVVGYMAYFEYQNGFKKVLYWSKEKMLKHADQFSKAFSKDAVDSPYPNKCKVSFADYEAGKYPKADDWKYSSFWYKDFNAMALKTLIRQLISKWGIMSIDLQKAFDADTETLEKENDILPESPAEDQFFGNPEGLEKPDVVEVEEKVVPKSARGRKKKEVSIEDENPNALQDGFFEGGVAE